MKKININSKTKEMKVNPDYFTGKASLKEFSSIIDSKEQKIYHVTFKGGARTKLHSHTGGQILIVTKGKGSLEMYTRTGKQKSHFPIKKVEKINISSGDIVYIPSKKLHTHGSTDKQQVFSHIAINANEKPNKPAKTTWYESNFKTQVTKILK